MSETTITFASERPQKKKPLDPHLFANEQDSVDAVLVQTGYPIWNLIGAWIAAAYDDNAVLAGYSDMPREEWEAAKQYYLDHKIIFDARIIGNTQPYADDDTPPLRTVEDYFAWLASQVRENEQVRSTANS